MEEQLKYFKGSYLTVIIGVLCAYFWGEKVLPGSGLLSIFTALMLGVLEVSLSFDNAVVNAIKLEKMTPVWQHRFITWGILVAVFGMRFLFPVAIVSIFAGISMGKVVDIAINNSTQYEMYLHQTHAPIVAFGGTFLLILFLSYFFNEEKTLHWFKPIEKLFAKLGHFKSIEIIIALLCLVVTANFVKENVQQEVLIAGISGIITYLLIDGLSHFLEARNEKLLAQSVKDGAKTGGFVAFLYLELIDASFSLDGVLGAFALSKDIVIITIGLAIGAMFVRSLTIMLVEKRTLKQYIYLEHGAHWAIGVLSIIMLYSTFAHIPEVVTGLLGMFFIVLAYITSIVHNNRLKNQTTGEN